MFSPDHPLLPASANPSTRNPRRRQRTSSDENGFILPKAKKQRSALTRETFVKPDGGEFRTNAMITMNGTANKDSNASSIDPKDLPVRTLKRSILKGSGRADGSLTLTKNEKYVVSKLPALPDRLGVNSKERLHGSFFPGSSYALAVTPNYAIVWSYRAVTTSPETFIFALPQDAKNNISSLPLVSLVAASISSAEPGLLVVMPSSGKITYWESITSAAAMDLTRQQRRGVEGSVGSMLSGEVVVQLVDAEPAGFILGFSSGRMASLNVRDNQGRPNVRVHMLRSHTGPTPGLFGSWRSVLTGKGWQNDVVAIRAGEKRKREERDIMVATTKGMVQLWSIHRSGQHTLKHEWNAREDMIAAINSAEPDMEPPANDNLEILDFAILPRQGMGDERNTDEVDERKSLLFLGLFRGQSSASYILFEVSIIQGSLIVGLIYRLRYYTTSPPRNNSWRPRLLMPKPCEAALIVFDRAVVIASFSQGADSPEEQLLREVHRFPRVFEDVVALRADLDVEVVGCESEDGSGPGDVNPRDTPPPGRVQSPACVLFVRGAGVIRLAIQSSRIGPTSEEITGLTAKSKIEQAISYGVQPKNPLDFSCRSEIQYSDEEVEKAAIEISSEILDSTSKAVSPMTPSLEHQLTQRATLLKELALYVKSTFRPLSRTAKWKLLWDAEKLAGARDIWRRNDISLKQRHADSAFNVLAELVDMLNTRLKTKPNAKKGELDKVRHWFTKDIGRLQVIVPWAFNTLKELYDDGEETHAHFAEWLYEANDIVLGALQTAFTFRQGNASLYGLETEPLEDGVLRDGAAYIGLPEFWTSTAVVTFLTRKQTEIGRDFAAKYLEKPFTKGDPDPAIIRKIVDETPSMVDISCQSYIERYQWLLAQPNEESKENGLRIKKEYLTTRQLQFRKLASINLADAGILLSEKYEDMGTLVELITEDMNQIRIQGVHSELSPEEERLYQQESKIQRDRFERYFLIFGEKFATALFTQYIKIGRLASLMSENKNHQKFLTKFLRANPTYAKIGWINEILAENNIQMGKTTLLDVASVKERDLWSKKVEVSIGKLALLAVQPRNQVGVKENKARADRVNTELELIAIQERLYQHIAPVIQVAVDENAEMQLVKADFGSQVTKDKPALSTVLEQGLTTLVAREAISPERLIDVLTLMDHHYNLGSSSELTGQEFYLALQVVKIIRIEDFAKAELLERIVWRRCMIRDDWTVINDTQLKDDRAVEQSTGDTALFSNLKVGYKSGFFKPPSSFTPLRPAEVLGAGSTAADLHDLFPEDLRGPIAADMRKEDERLQVYLDQGRLDDWFSGVVDAAQKSLQDELEMEMMMAKRRRSAELRLREEQKKVTRQLETERSAGNGDEGRLTGEGFDS
ncbi:MAG: hypothetical protein M1816_007436 [Peltula sp. TS41687]|nr:MAG: hypothetical protein M1816_007436 [Peltula sp. TS41687]